MNFDRSVWEREDSVIYKSMPRWWPCPTCNGGLSVIDGTLHEKFFAIPRGCPPDVSAELRRAFGLFWSDTQAAANALRAAIELVLDQRSVPRETQTKRGKTSYLPLAGRLKEFRQQEPEFGEMLEAVKWLGNHGSHSKKALIQKKDLFDGFQCISTVIDELYEHRPRREEAAMVAKHINRRRGPESLTWSAGS